MNAILPWLKVPTAPAAPAPVAAPAAPTPAPELTLVEFLERVLPPKGNYCLFRTTTRKHTWADSIESLVAATERMGNATDVYFATATFKTTDARTQANVDGLKAFRLDLDAGEKKLAKHGPGEVYATQADALEGLGAFVADTGLAPSLTISSGEGLHVYWQLDKPVDGGTWTPVAKQFQKFCVAHGLKVDSSVTADSARILRPIGTKHPNGKTVSVLEDTGKVYSLADFAGIVGKASEPAPVAYDTSINADIAPMALPDNRTRDFALIQKSCGVMAAFAAGEPQSEPLWRDTMGIPKYCTGGEHLIHKYSALCSEYDRAETQGKFDRWTAGPTTCATFAKHKPDTCSKCPSWGKITSPIQLGDTREAQQQAKDDGRKGLEEAVAQGRIEPFVDQDGVVDYIIKFTRDGKQCRNVLRSGSQEAMDAIIHAATVNGGKSPSDKAIADFEARLRVAAKQSGQIRQTHLRVAKQDGVIFHDLGPGKLARITSVGWDVVDESGDAPLFVRGAGAGELPTPHFNGDAVAAFAHLAGHYRTQFGLDVGAAVVAVALLLDTLNPNSTHPVREYVGAGGSGKSIQAEHDVNLIDPVDGGRRTIGGKLDDVAAAAQQQYCLMVDNASRIDKATSDMFCVISTGGTLVVREYYEQGRTIALKLHRALFITGVSPVCTAPDLMTRVVRRELQPMAGGGYVTDEELRAAFAEARPKLLGAIYTLLSAAMRQLPEVRKRKRWPHRMVSFDQLGEAMVIAGGGKPGKFLEIMGGIRERMARRTASGDSFVIALLAALRKLAAKPTDAVQVSLRAVVNRKPSVSVMEIDGHIQITARASALRSIMPRPTFGGKRSTNPRLVNHAQFLHACVISTQMQRRKCKTERNIGWHTWRLPSSKG